ncbi:MAG TPA: excinuclease ABC subunit UvrC [Clostridiales bacterium]|nr:excinuclease ABC subunit UvrC [Clostridiales bacterium]
MFEIKKELKKLPDKPGVYIMRNENDEIIYVGKAIKLKNRVRQYFQNSNNHSSKIKKMVSNIDHFEYIITDSEVEALVLECNLIKENRPKYNTMLKDDKTYPFIKVTINEPYPRVLFTRLVKKDKAKYFGPFPSVTAVKDIIDLLRKIYKIRTCNRNLPKDIGKERPCLYYHIGQCNAPCQGYITQEEYFNDIDKVLKFLGGNYKDVIALLEERMNEEAKNLEYEKAILTRELLNSINKISIEQNATNTDLADRDIIAFAKNKDDAVVQTFYIRGGKLIGREKNYLTGVEEEENASIMNSFIKQFYSGTPYIPKEIYLAEEVEEEELLSKWLTARKGQKVIIKVPKKGQKERLVELAKKNAELIMEQDAGKIKREEARTIGALKQLSQMLEIPLIKRIESFDISNTAGYENVGSMVVYEDGKPKRADYRKFKIKTVKGPDDYASMYEMLKRRFIRAENESKQLIEKNIELSLGSFTRYPDLILMDGGKGQVNVALKVMYELNISIPVCGMVKDDNHRTDHLYYNNKEIAIDKSSELFKLITRIQDETHRFAIEFHRTLRSNKQVKSILDEIPTIGDKRRRELMRHFKSIDLIKVASLEELKKTPSMNEKSAHEVYKFFR